MDDDTLSDGRTHEHPGGCLRLSHSIVHMVCSRMFSFVRACLSDGGKCLKRYPYLTIRNEAFVAVLLRLLLMTSICCLGYSIMMTDSLRAQELESPDTTQPAPNDSSTAMGHALKEHCSFPESTGFENIQIEAADIHLHEQLFESVLHASLMQRLDHPQTDRIRAYCYRRLLIVIRQDLRNPHPTGWVQVNFMVNDIAALQQELEATARTALGTLDVKERDNIVRFRAKPGVMRNNRKVDRLEVYGPEGFLIGFDQLRD